ncbi:MAG: helix-turn-helix domain-containing protein [Cryomorphaceae bacterium]|nr:helix-turn-helix domain-containing protein [Cryomorphaceae bacterium]
MKKNLNTNQLTSLDLEKLNISEGDKVSRKFMMLIEGTYGIGVKKSIEKYGYTEQRYYQIKKDFAENGYEALIDQKRGPRDKHIRKKQIEMQIIRLRFLDPESNAAVIAQKLSQMGIKISQRSVERTITEYGLQKTTL